MIVIAGGARSAGIPLHWRQSALAAARGLPAAMIRSADDEVVGPRESLRRRHGPFLIAFVIVHPDARRDDGESASHRLRMIPTSRGDATTPSSPADCASAASRST